MSATVHWQKSSYSGGAQDNDCVEVGTSSAGVHIRESDAPATVLAPGRDALRALIRGVRAGEFDRI